MNNPIETFSPSSFSDLYAGLEGLVHAATRTHDVIASGDFKAMGRLAPELLLKVLVVGILHKVGGRAAITSESSSIKKLQFPGKDPIKAPAGFEWRGKAGAVKGSKDGNYYNPKTGESLRPDLDHADPVGPH